MLIEFLVKILRERAVICRECFLFQLSERTKDPLHFRLYSVSNILYKHYSHNIKKLTNTSEKVSWVVQDKLTCSGNKVILSCHYRATVL